VRQNIVRWGAVVGALPRILHYREILGATETYFDRLRIVNEALGPHWVFRLAEAVGFEQIKANRPSWFRFYVEDVDRLHCPLDPGAPETEAYLGRRYSDMDMAFYAGMGFDGYRLVLQTQRTVSLGDKSINFDGRHRLTSSVALKNELAEYDRARSIPKGHYYTAYAKTLTTLYDTIECVVADSAVVEECDEEMLERAMAGCLIVMCGAHQGCLTHPSSAEKFQAQMESLVIFNLAQHVLTGKVVLDDRFASAERIVA